MSKIIGEVILEETLGIMVAKTVEKNIEAAIEMTVTTEAGTGLEKGHFPEKNYDNNRTRSTSNSRSRS